MFKVISETTQRMDEKDKSGDIWSLQLYTYYLWADEVPQWSVKNKPNGYA